MSDPSYWSELHAYLHNIELSTTIDESIELTSKFLRRPFSVIDPAMNLVGYYPRHATGDADWDSLITLGHVHSKYASLLRESGPPVSPSSLQVYCGKDGEMTKYRCMLSSGMLLLGGAMVLENGVPFTRDDETAMIIACQAFTSSLHSLHFAQLEYRYAEESILCDLLTQSPSEVLEKMKTRHPDLYQLESQPLLVGYIPTAPGDYWLAAYWQRVLAPEFDGCRIIPFNRNLIFFMPCKTRAYPDICAALRTQMQTIGLELGLSDPFFSFLHFKTHFENARLALNAGRGVSPGQSLYTVDAYRLPILIHHLRQSQTAPSCCHPAALRMMRHDAQYGTQYCRILLAYLTHFHNRSLACQALFLHRNTLTYHLERIAALFEIDLNDPDTCTVMLLSLMLIQGEAGQDRSAKVPSD